MSSPTPKKKDKTRVPFGGGIDIGGMELIVVFIHEVMLSWEVGN